MLYSYTVDRNTWLKVYILLIKAASSEKADVWQDRITNEEVRRRCGVENLEHRLRKMRLFGHEKCRDENSILRRAVELEVGDRRPVGRPKKTRIKEVEEDMFKLNITEDMAEDRKQWRQLISSPTPGVGN